MVEKELTPEEQRALNVKTTLESKLIQSVIGGNEVKGNQFLYGQLAGGERTYADAMNSEDVNKEKVEIYKGKQAERQQLGIVEEAPSTTNYDIIAKLKRQLGEVQSMAKLSELEKYAKSAGANLDFEVPENLKDYSQADLIQKAITEDRRIDLSKLADDEKDAWQMYEVLTQAYERALGVKAAQTNYFADLSSVGKKISDKYVASD